MEPQTPAPAPSTPPQPQVPTPTPESVAAPTPPAPTPAPEAPVPQQPPVAGLPTVVSSKFSVFQAIKDVASSIKKKPSQTLVPLVLGYVVSVALALVTLVIGASSAAVAFSIGPASMGGIWMLIAFVFVAFLIQLVVQTTFNSAYIMALKDAFQDTAGQGVGAYFKHGFQKFGRVFAATLLVFAYAIGPIFLAVAIGILGSFVESIKMITYILALVAYLGAMVWMMIALLRYALYWQVAIFEPDVSVMQIPKRSHELMVGKAQWFIVRGFVLILAVAILISVLTGGGSSATDHSSTPNLLSNIISIVLVPFAYGVPTLLYLKLAGDRKQSLSQAPAQVSAQPPVVDAHS